jgi:hypothetical protein
MKQRHKHADVIHAWAEGKDIEWLDFEVAVWRTYEGRDPAFSSCSLDWRIKPTIVKKEGWVNVYSKDTCLVCGISNGIYKRKETADNYATSNRVACIRIEWDEEV